MRSCHIDWKKNEVYSIIAGELNYREETWWPLEHWQWNGLRLYVQSWIMRMGDRGETRGEPGGTGSTFQQYDSN